MVVKHHIIRRLTVTGGFLDGLDIEFTDGLVCIIGGRGSGKTTVLELIRFALDHLPDMNTGDKKAAKRFKDLIDANLDHGTVELEFETQDGQIYRIQRTAGESPLLYDDEGNPADPSILQSRIGIDAAIFSQNEVEEIALQPSYLRDVIDRFCSRELSDVRHEIRQTVEALTANASDIVQLTLEEQKGLEEIRDLPAMEGKLAKIKLELAKIKLDTDLQKASAQKELRVRESSAISRINPVLLEAQRVMAPVQREIIGEFQQIFTDELLNGPNGETFEKLRDVLRSEVKKFRDSVNAASDALKSMQEAASAALQGLKTTHQPQEKVFQDLAKQHKAHQQMLQEMHTLNKQVEQQKTRRTELDTFKKRLIELHERRQDLLATFSDLTERRYQIRAEVADGLNEQLNGRIRVRIEQNAEHSTYYKFLEKNRNSSLSRYKRELDRIAQRVAPVELARMAREMESESLSIEADLGEEYAAATLKMIKADPRTAFDLEIIEQDDVPCIELQIGQAWRPSHKLSTGQMCSVVLPLLLLEDAAPLLIDQPEDNLDNSFIYELIIGQIRKTSKRRQMIFITHNPNIPVLGLANQVIRMKYDDENQDRNPASGSVEEMKDYIIETMEGGEKAFKERLEKYGW